MKEFQEKRRLKKIFLSRPIFVLVFIAAVFLSMSVFKVYQKSRQAVLWNEAARKELNIAEKRKADLEAKIARLQTEAGAEEELRKKFQVKREGEEYIVILDEEISETAEDRTEAPVGVFEKVWIFIKNIF